MLEAPAGTSTPGAVIASVAERSSRWPGCSDHALAFRSAAPTATAPGAEAGEEIPGEPASPPPATTTAPAAIALRTAGSFSSASPDARETLMTSAPSRAACSMSAAGEASESV